MTNRARVVDHRYGKAGVRLLRLDRSSERHELFEATVEISLEGGFEEAYYDGDNRRVLPTDTQKNTVYALARRHPFSCGEELAILLGRHFVGEQEQVDTATVLVSEKPWDRLGGHDAAFVAGGEQRATARALVDRDGVRVQSGIDGLVILKSSRSAFKGYPRDAYTTLEETDDRILATRLEASWDYAPAGHQVELDFVGVRQRLQQAMFDTFADHDSESVQQTLYLMGDAALAAAPEIERIHLRMPNKHYLLANLAPLGLDNPNHIFVPIDEPAGMIEGTLERA